MVTIRGASAVDGTNQEFGFGKFIGSWMRASIIDSEPQKTIPFL